jgi:hypothetical protein
MIRGVGRIARISLVLISLATCSDAPAVAQFQLQEHEATQTFVTSRYIEVRAINTVLSTGVAHMQAEAKSIETGCPGVLAHAPVSSQADELEAELAFAVALAYVEPLREPIDGFASAMFMDHLQWRDRELHDLVYAYVREQASILGLHTPNF